MTRFILFFSVIFLTYALLVAYPYYRLVKSSFSPSIRTGYVVVFASTPLFLLFGRYADRNLSPDIAYWSFLLGLLLLGFSLYMFIFTLFLDMYKGFVELSKRFLGINPLPKPSGRLAFALVMLLSLSVSAYSYYETLNLKVVRIKLYTDKLPEGVDRLKIMHISDVHLGPVMGMDKVRMLYRVWEREKPDIVVDTGDLVDGNMRNKGYLAGELSKMEAPYGKFAVLGNHEYFRGWEQALEFAERAGYRVLRNEIVDLGAISIVGVDDDTCKLVSACNGIREEEILKRVDRGNFVLLLKHKPKIEKSMLGSFDLMLSGHTHGGLYLPVGKFIIKKMFLTDAGFIYLGNSSYAYVSSGVGTGGPPMRFLVPPAVAIIAIQRNFDKN